MANGGISGAAYRAIRKRYQARKARLEASKYGGSLRVRRMEDMPLWSEISEAEREDEFRYWQNKEATGFGVRQMKKQIEKYGDLARIFDVDEPDWQEFQNWVITIGTDYIWGSPEEDPRNYGHSLGHNKYEATDFNWETNVPVREIKKQYEIFLINHSQRWRTSEPSSSNVYRS